MSEKKDEPKTVSVMSRECPVCGQRAMDTHFHQDGRVVRKCGWCGRESGFTLQIRNDGKALRITNVDYQD